MKLAVLVVLVGGCGSGAARDAFVCTQSASITGSVGGQTFGPVTSATIERFSDTEYTHTSVVLSDGTSQLTIARSTMSQTTSFLAGSASGSGTFSYTAIDPGCATGTFHADFQGETLDGSFTAARICTHPTCEPL